MALSDFVAPKGSGVPDYVGMFVCSSGFGLDTLTKEFKEAGDDYSYIMVRNRGGCTGRVVGWLGWLGVDEAGGVGFNVEFCCFFVSAPLRQNTPAPVMCLASSSSLTIPLHIHIQYVSCACLFLYECMNVCMCLLLLQAEALADRLAEALAEVLHERVRKEYWVRYPSYPAELPELPSRATRVTQQSYPRY